MKKATGIWLVTAACLVLAGGILFCLTMAAHHWDFSLLDSGQTETKTVEVAEAFKNISIHSDTEEIVFLPSGDGSCKVVCLEREKEAHTVTVLGDTLTIRRIDSRNWYDALSLFSFVSPTITVYLPQGEYTALRIEEETGDISIPGEFAFDSVDIRLSTGDVACRASASGLLRVKTTTGDIDLEGLSAGELDLTVSTGHVRVRSVDCGGNVGIAVSTGKTDLTEVSCINLRSTGDTGDMTLTNVAASGTISLARATGDIRFAHCDAGELAVVTDTGDVTGTLLSDKVFIVHSDTGRIDVPETTSGGRCKITTDTGDIRIGIANL